MEVACLSNGRDLYIHRKRGIQIDVQDFDVVADDNLRATDCDPSVSIRAFGERLSIVPNAIASVLLAFSNRPLTWNQRVTSSTQLVSCVWSAGDLTVV